MVGLEVITALAASEAVGNLGKSLGKSVYDQLKANVIGKLAKEAEAKRDAYLTKDHDPTAAIEKRRVDLIQRLTVCQSQIILEVPDKDEVVRLELIALDQCKSLYGATQEVEIGQVEMVISQIELFLKRNQANIDTRASHRALAVWVVVLIVTALIGLIALSPALMISTDSVIPLIRVPLPIVIWSSIGSLGAMLYRFNNSTDAELADPLRWSFTRPLTGVLMGIITYMAFKIGTLVLQPTAVGVSGAKGVPVPEELLWMAAFLAGFSDRFADSILRTLAGRLGGEKQAELVTLDRSVAGSGSSLGGILERLAASTKQGRVTLINAPVPSETANDEVGVQSGPQSKRERQKGKGSKAVAKPSSTGGESPAGTQKADQIQGMVVQLRDGGD